MVERPLYYFEWKTTMSMNALVVDLVNLRSMESFFLSILYTCLHEETLAELLENLNVATPSYENLKNFISPFKHFL